MPTLISKLDLSFSDVRVALPERLHGIDVQGWCDSWFITIIIPFPFRPTMWPILSPEGMSTIATWALEEVHPRLRAVDLRSYLSSHVLDNRKPL